MPTKLTEAQRVLLQSGVQREDRFIPAPTGSKGAATKKFSTKLIEEGLAKEVKAKPGVPIWRIADANRSLKAPMRHSTEKVLDRPRLGAEMRVAVSNSASQQAQNCTPDA